MIRHLLILLPLIIALPGHAAENKPPWLQPEVLKAAVNIGLTEAQRPQFRDAITQLAQNQISATNKLLRQNNIADLDRRFTTVINRQFKKMDREMAQFLTPTQLPKYQIYRDTLRAHMTRSTARRGRSSRDWVNETERTLDQGAIQHH